MAIARVQNTGIYQPSGTSGSIAYGSSNTGGNLLIVAINSYKGNDTLSVTDTQGNTWLQATTATNSTTITNTQAIFYAKNCRGGANTITGHWTATQGEVHISEWSGVDTLAPLDKVSTAIGTTFPASTPSVTTSLSGELIFGISSVLTSCTEGAGFTRLSMLNGDSSEYEIQTTAGSVAATWAVGTTGTNGGWMASMATFKPASTIYMPRVALLQNVGNTSSTSPVSATLASTVQQGNVIIASIVASDGAHIFSPTVSDNLGHNWSPAVARSTAADGATYIFYTTVQTVGTMTVTMSNAATATFNSIEVSEWRGLTGTVDGTPVVTAQQIANATSGNVTTTANGDLIYGWVDLFGTGAAGSDCTKIDVLGGKVIAEYKIQPSAGTTNVSYTSSATGTDTVAIAAFKAASTAVTGTGTSSLSLTPVLAVLGACSVSGISSITAPSRVIGSCSISGFGSISLSSLVVPTCTVGGQASVGLTPTNAATGVDTVRGTASVSLNSSFLLRSISVAGISNVSLTATYAVLGTCPIHGVASLSMAPDISAVLGSTTERGTSTVALGSVLMAALGECAIAGLSFAVESTFAFLASAIFSSGATVDPAYTLYDPGPATRTSQLAIVGKSSLSPVPFQKFKQSNSVAARATVVPTLVLYLQGHGSALGFGSLSLFHTIAFGSAGQSGSGTVTVQRGIPFTPVTESTTPFSVVRATKAKTYKYRDLNLLFSANPISSDVSAVVDAEAVKTAVKNLVFTDHYERLFHPEIGSNVRASLFEPLTTVTAFTMRKYITDVITNFEPRVKLVSVDVIAYPEQNGYSATITFYINNITDQASISFFLERLR
jgi:phage baseplate assembly protein W